MSSPKAPLHVSLVAIPESLSFPVSSIYETLQILGSMESNGSDPPPFTVEIVGQEQGVLETATGLPVGVQRSFSDVDRSDIVIVTSMNAGENNEWTSGRHPEAVSWFRNMHQQGAVMCSSCTGVLLLAETGLLDGLDATIHWAYAPTFRRNFPEVRLQLKEVLITGGERQEFVMAGATSSWQDLTLYLVTRFAGADIAREIGKFMLFQWHTETMAPYVSFNPPTDHDDALIRDVQEWLEERIAIDGPLDKMIERSGLAESTFKRRFKRVTGQPPLRYVQLLRIERAKRKLEATDDPIDNISWQVGYENTAFFRRLFKRATRMTPGEYRRKFQTPEFARS